MINVERCKAQDRWLMPNTGMLIFHYKDGKFVLDQEPINVNEYRQIYHPKTIDMYLMRHGETRFNVQERMQGRCDSPLTEKGIQEAQEAAEELKDIPFSTIMFQQRKGRVIPRKSSLSITQEILSIPKRFAKLTMVILKV